MKVLVTGATGFIGNYVIEELLMRNIKVVATSSKVTKAKEKSWFSKVEYYPFNFNIDNLQNLYDYFNKPTHLIHLAWQGLPNYNEDFHLKECLPQQKNFLNNLINNGLHDITVTGTCFEYGMQEGELKETIDCKPANNYAIAKNELRIHLEKFKKEANLSFKWLRLFYMYGNGQNSKSLIPQLNDALQKKEPIFNMSGGEQIRDFMSVEEVAKNIVTIALQNKIEGLINCCSGNPITVKQFVLNYLKTKNATIKLNLGYYPYPNFEPFKFWGNTEKLNKIINK